MKLKLDEKCHVTFHHNTNIFPPFKLMVAVGIGPLLAIKYIQYLYRPSTIHVLQRMERTQCEPTVTSIEPQPYQPLLYDSESSRKSRGSWSLDPCTDWQVIIEQWFFVVHSWFQKLYSFQYTELIVNSLYRDRMQQSGPSLKKEERK